ncbi:hypothetical protein CLV24_12826 [Pontibacter ummariensis]|uniref:Uncharacterized protein n=1 Tax=Pontibacter ummariensis TaxID=1610492 RepID=A0A239K7F5_9BACT|nr:hypothetical protein [Pontibacter ummariensis]PRY06044.1 hypothetical protein CLV24_12826 [Pontibacter ummariensis]SNT14396.1 hypothetical protein SAMN06296052_12726 [Pontibacter ummariensis]
MKNITNIFKTGLAVLFAAVLGFGCNGERPATDPIDDTSTSEAIVDKTDAEHLMEPRPAAIGDTAVTAEQADQFGDLPSNVDTAARRMHQLDIQKQLEENPNQRPEISAPTNRDIDGT